MSEETAQSLKLFYCYASEDQQWRDEIDLHLHDLKLQCHITRVFDGVLPLNEQQGERFPIQMFLAHLRNADLVFLLISEHFKAANYVPVPELRNRLEWGRRTGYCSVISLLLEDVDWDGSPFASRIVLPSDRPLAEWLDREMALQNIEKGIRATVEKLWLTRGDWLLREASNYEEALEAYEEAIRLNSSVKWPWYGKGNALSELDRYEEALVAYDEAIQLDPAFAWAYHAKGFALSRLKCYKEAQQAYDEAIRLEPFRAANWYWKGEVLKAMRRRKEAQQAKKKARELGWRFR